MKLSAPLAVLALLFTGAQAVDTNDKFVERQLKSDSGDDLEGEVAQLFFCGEDKKAVRFFCAWGANRVTRRLGESEEGIKLYSTRPEHLNLGGRQLTAAELGDATLGGRKLADIKPVELGTVKCTMKWQGQEITQTWDFPDQWQQGDKKSDRGGIDFEAYGFGRISPYVFDNGDTLFGALQLTIVSVINPVTNKNFIFMDKDDPKIFCPGEVPS